LLEEHTVPDLRQRGIKRYPPSFPPAAVASSSRGPRPPPPSFSLAHAQELKYVPFYKWRFSKARFSIHQLNSDDIRNQNRPFLYPEHFLLHSYLRRFLIRRWGRSGSTSCITRRRRRRRRPRPLGLGRGGGFLLTGRKGTIKGAIRGKGCEGLIDSYDSVQIKRSFTYSTIPRNFGNFHKIISRRTIPLNC
jgi:hypothetical protein